MSSKYFFLALVVVALAAVPVSASFINVTTDTLLFYDDFDSQPVANVSHIGYADDATVGLPLSQSVGSYTYNIVSPNRTIQVTDHSGANQSPYTAFIDPGPYTPQGTTNTNYLRLFRANDNQYIMYQNLTSPQTTPNHVIHWEEMICIEGNGSESNFQIFFQNTVALPSTTTLLGFKADKDGVIKTYPTWSTVNGVTWTQGVWQKWEVDYTLGATTFDLTVAGTKVTGVPLNSSTSGINTVAYLQYKYQGYSVGPFCLDEEPVVPEPSTLVLLASGLLGLLAYAWRKRK